MRRILTRSSICSPSWICSPSSILKRFSARFSSPPWTRFGPALWTERRRGPASGSSKTLWTAPRKRGCPALPRRPRFRRRRPKRRRRRKTKTGCRKSCFRNSAPKRRRKMRRPRTKAPGAVSARRRNKKAKAQRRQPLSISSVSWLHSHSRAYSAVSTRLILVIIFTLSFRYWNRNR